VIELHRLTADDWREWRDLRLQALTEAPTAFSATLAEWQGQGDTEARWRQRLTAVPFNMSAIVGGETLGQVSAVVAGDASSVELMSMYVAPAARGAGAGDALVAAVCEWAAWLGITTVTLGVRGTNRHAIALYERAGFVTDPTGHRTDCDVTMTRTIG
jgi:ribosomal protein S18 acetylase RimI-like enzyme